MAETVKAEVSQRLAFRTTYGRTLAAMTPDQLRSYVVGMSQARVIADLAYADLLRSMSPEQRASFLEKPLAVAQQEAQQRWIAHVVPLTPDGEAAYGDLNSLRARISRAARDDALNRADAARGEGMERTQAFNAKFNPPSAVGHGPNTMPQWPGPYGSDWPAPYGTPRPTGV